MDTATEMNQDFQGFHRLWSRRHTLNLEEEDDLLLDNQTFASAKVDCNDNNLLKSRSSSPIPKCMPCTNYSQNIPVPQYKVPCNCSFEALKSLEVDGSEIGDIPAKYTVYNLKKHEFPAIGIYIDPRIVAGFKYRVRPLQKNPDKEKWFFKSGALKLESIGRGYSRRITFAPEKGNLNSNPNYFWADSNEYGFAFELEVVSPGDKFTVFDANRLAVGNLEVLQNQAPQEEVGHRVISDGSIEKSARVRTLCKVEWYEGDNSELIVPMNGIAVSIKSKNGVWTKVIGATVGNHPRRGFTLKPGISSGLRSTVVKGESIGDVPTTYTIIGLESYELPVIGTYVDPRIVPGFHYRVRPALGKRKPLFNGEPLQLQSIGMGYGKRLVFASNSLNRPDNYLWSDSHPDGLGFEPSAVRAGMKFEVYAGQLRLGEATVFRTDAPQIEKKQALLEENGKKGILKEIQVELTCSMSLDTTGSDKETEAVTMRVSGTAIVVKAPGEISAKILRVQDIGLDSHLNILFVTQWEELVFIPL